MLYVVLFILFLVFFFFAAIKIASMEDEFIKNEMAKYRENVKF